MSKFGVEFCKSCKKAFSPYDLEDGKCWDCQQDDLRLDKNQASKNNPDHESEKIWMTKQQDLTA